MAVSSIAYKFTILGGPAIGVDWLNDTGADVEIGNAIKYGLIQGIVVAGNSQDGSTKVLSTARGVVAFYPAGFKVLGPTSTTEGFATGSLLYLDLTNQRLTSTAVTAANGGLKVGYAANSKAAGTGTDAVVFWNATLPV